MGGWGSPLLILWAQRPCIGKLLAKVEDSQLPRSPAPKHRDALAQGTVLNGYQLLAVLGRGGFGITYRAADLLEQFFAIKEFFPRQFAMRAGMEVVAASESDEEMFVDCRRRFLTEARLLAALGRNGGAPGIVRVVTFFEANNTAYSVMEMLVGETLDEVLRTGTQPIPAQRVVSLLQGILTPLARVHEAGFLHRDIKPANILIRPNGQPVLIDFGSARDMGPSANATYTQVYSGHYAPIEQMLHGGQQGPYSDIYSVGGVAYRAIGGTLVDARTRQHAALSNAPDPLVPAVDVGRDRYPASLLKTIDRALAVSADERPQCVAEVLDLLGIHADGDATTRRIDTAKSRAPVAPDGARSKDGSPRPAVQTLPIGQGRPLFADNRPSHERNPRRPLNSGRGQDDEAASVQRRPRLARMAIPIALTLLIVAIGFSTYYWFTGPGLSVTQEGASATAETAPAPAETFPATPESPRVTQESVAAEAKAPDEPSVTPPVASASTVSEEESWLPEDRRNVRVVLRLLRITTTPVTEEPFDGTEKAAIARLRAMISADPLGGAAGTELRDPRKLGLRLRTLLTRGPASPRGVPDSDAATPEARYARGWDAQNGPDHDVSEAIYWYGLAARVGDLGAWTQLGLLLVRSHGAVAARDAALLWWIGSQGGAAVASYNLGALYDRSADVPRDRNLALHWYNVAVSQGNEPAVEALRKLAP
jgi:serine/threonine protein kinase